MIQLDYSIDVTLQNPGPVAIKMSLIDLDRGELDLLGATIFFDGMTVVGSDVRRRVTLDFTADGEARFPTDAVKIAATRDLWTAVLELYLPSLVTAAEPVIV